MSRYIWWRGNRPIAVSPTQRPFLAGYIMDCKPPYPPVSTIGPYWGGTKVATIAVIAICLNSSFVLKLTLDLRFRGCHTKALTSWQVSKQWSRVKVTVTVKDLSISLVRPLLASPAETGPRVSCSRRRAPHLEGAVSYSRWRKLHKPHISLLQYFFSYSN